MRKSIYILILILFASTCFAGGVTDKVKSVIARKNAAAACSYPTIDSSTGTSDTNGNHICGGPVGGRGVGYRYTTTSGTDPIRITISLRKTGSPVCTITAKIYTDSSNLPNTLLGTSTTSIACADLTTSQALYDFDFSPAVSLDTGTLYWVTVEPTSVTTCDSSNNVGSQITDSGGAVGARFDYYDGANWQAIDNGYKFTFATKSCN